MDEPYGEDRPDAVAIVGMAGRFPGAKNVSEFWRNLRDGAESISYFSDEELLSAGVSPALAADPNYVKAKGVLDEIEMFDAQFFGYSPREAEIMDPQQRIFLECAWETLEDASCDPSTYPGLIGVFAGTGMSTYLFNIYSNKPLMGLVGGFQVMLGNDKDHLTTHVSYKMNLRGPSIAVQTACSTSLVAVCMAAQSLLNYECDMALAGGVLVGVPHRVGQYYREGGIVSPDGHCRAFDEDAQGTVGGSGVGVVALKRLSDALKDADHIRAVILGAAVNNDGALKVGYTAPSVEGQAEVIAMAHAMAGIDPRTISYVEAHGTGTSLGDPIEIAALTQAFRLGTNDTQFCAIGSVKTNIGHLDPAAGVAGLIKTVLALEHGMLPPSLHFRRPNPNIDFASSPFYVNNQLAEWKTGLTPRRSGISSFGIGGTNAHVVLEEAPAVGASGPSRQWQLLTLSAKTGAALDKVTANMAEYLEVHPDANLADVTYTLQVGRKALNRRRIVVCRDPGEASAVLRALDSGKVFTGVAEPGGLPITFMFPGQGSQYVNMGRELYDTEAQFREQVDLCCEILRPHLGFDLRDVIYPRQGDDADAAEKINQTWITQPALFVVGYAFARLWMAWGVRPSAMIGHSVGEYVAACLAGVFNLEDALTVVARRGRMIQDLPGGAMLSVPLAESKVRDILEGDFDGVNLALAAVNGPSLCVVSGPGEAVDRLRDRLARRGLESRRLHTSHAFHSAMIEPVVEPLALEVQKIKLQSPTLPFISNVTGTWITPDQAANPEYWAQHARQTVRFADGLRELLRRPGQILLETGPGQTLATFARQQIQQSEKSSQEQSSAHAGSVVLSSSRHPYDRQSDVAFLLTTLGRLWLAGAQPDWHAFHSGERRARLPLPTYPFERKRYWVEAEYMRDLDESSGLALDRTRGAQAAKTLNISNWFYVPTWKRGIPARLLEQPSERKLRYLVFSDSLGLGAKLVRHLRQQGYEVTVVMRGEHFISKGDSLYSINPRQSESYSTLVGELLSLGTAPDVIVHLWGMTSDYHAGLTQESFDRCQEYGLYSILSLCRALDVRGVTRLIKIGVVSNHLYSVTGKERLQPEKATVLGACKVIPQEYPNITCVSIDVDADTSALKGQDGWAAEVAGCLEAELRSDSHDRVVAYRGGHRWVQSFEALTLPPQVQAAGPAEGQPLRFGLRQGGVYLITGGLGNIGLALAEHLASTAKAKLVLVSRSAFPPPEEWESRLTKREARGGVEHTIRRLRAIEDLGAQVMVAQADTSSAEQLSRVVEQARRQFGVLHGVIHAAGVTGVEAFKPVRDADRAVCEVHFKPKVYGLLALQEAFQGQHLDFCLLMSSISSVLGGLGFAAYSAANIFMDSFAAAQGTTGSFPWISVGWDGWQFNRERDSNIEEGEYRSRSGPGSALSALAITPAEGAEAFERILSLGPELGSLPQLIVSTGDLQSRVDLWVKLESLDRDRSAGQQGGQGHENEQGQGVELHERPDLPSVYAAPATDLERTIARIWQELLGLEQVGIHDNFFELGGHSLLAIQVVSRLREAMPGELSVHTLFDAPTIAQLAAILEKGQAAEAERQPVEMAEMLAFVEQLSDNEVRELLGTDEATDTEKAMAVTAPWTSEADALALANNAEDLAGASGVKTRTRRFYNSINAQLDSQVAGEHAMFLNYGYVADGSPEYARFRLPEYQLNRNPTKLVLEVIGDCNLTGCQVLDVGCGRGGTISVITRYFKPYLAAGIDLSSNAIRYCVRNRRDERAYFLEGDAENLPFTDGSFDAITNVESSHSYPDVFAFYREVYRTLRTGGYFLYTDLFPVDLIEEYREYLQQLGFVIERDQDVTRNVLLSCDESARMQLGAFGGGDGQASQARHAAHADGAERAHAKIAVLEDFLAVPGSQPYQDMLTGSAEYRILRLWKADGAGLHRH